jgi:hypothetical protein
MAPAVPYRSVTVSTSSFPPETFSVRVSDDALLAWLRERVPLRHRGYPDRPPDVDTPTLRAWLPRLGEQALPYFRDRPTRSTGLGDALVFPVLTATWHRANGITTKVIITGLGDGGFLSRVVIVDASGDCPVDKAHRLGPDLDPDAVWREIETIVMAINEAPMGWGPDDPLVTDYLGYLALDDEVEAAEAEARAAGLLAPEWVH